MHAPLIAGCPGSCNPGQFTTSMAPGKKKAKRGGQPTTPFRVALLTDFETP
jgi:hypothetical protein